VSILTATRRCGLALVAVLLLASSAFASEEGEIRSVPGSQEYDLKAAFLFNFARFVEWPPDAFATAATPLTIGILGDDPFGESLDDIVADESVHNRKLTVRRYASLETLGPCQILFVCPSEAGHWEQIAARLDRHSVLTVGEGSTFTDHSGMIGFEMVRNRLRLRINLAAARAAKLTISSQLLRQAKIVGPRVQP
jgi:hypothetical protein